MYTFDLGPCEYIAYFLKREEGRKGKKEESREKEEMGKWKEEGRTEEGRKEGKAERKGRRKKRREGASFLFFRSGLLSLQPYCCLCYNDP